MLWFEKKRITLLRTQSYRPSLLTILQANILESKKGPQTVESLYNLTEVNVKIFQDYLHNLSAWKYRRTSIPVYKPIRDLRSSSHDLIGFNEGWTSPAFLRRYGTVYYWREDIVIQLKLWKHLKTLRRRKCCQLSGNLFTTLRIILYI